MNRDGLSALALPATALVATIWIAIACGVGGGGTPAPAATAGPTLLGTAPAQTAPLATGTLTTSAPPSTPSETMSASLSVAQPPAGSLSADGGPPVVGLLGSYCWNTNAASACVDSPPFTDSGPDLPTLALTASQTQLSFSLAGSYPFIGWSANYVDDNGNEVPLGNLQTSFDPDAAGPSPATITQAQFGVPPAGDTWTVQVFIRFADGGDSSYGWNVTVP